MKRFRAFIFEHQDFQVCAACVNFIGYFPCYRDWHDVYFGGDE